MEKITCLILLIASLGFADFNVGIVNDPIDVAFVFIENGDANTVYVIEYSEDLQTWQDYITLLGDFAVEAQPGFYRARILEIIP